MGSCRSSGGRKPSVSSHFLFACLLLVSVISLSLILTGCSQQKTYPIRPGNDPFMYSGSDDVGVLLIHGFTASPWEVKELGEYLAMRNMTVYGILLPGHGTAPEDMKNYKWQDWYNASESAYLELKKKVSKVYVGGLSLGAMIGFMIAENNDVQGVISISSPIYLRNTNSQYADVIKYVQEYVPAPNMTDETALYYYDKRAVSSVEQLMDMIKAYRAELSKVTSPAFIAQAEEDRTVQPYSAAIIYEGISSKHKELKWYKTDYHVLTKSPVKDDLFLDIAEFIDKTS